MPPSALLTTPYADILEKLVRSILRAQADILAKMRDQIDICDVPDQLINRHFVWLSLHAGRGFNRHLYDGSADGALHPLRNQEMRKKGRETKLLNLFEAGGSVPTTEFLWMEQFVRSEPTRLSSIVKNEMSKWATIQVRRGRSNTDGKTVSVPSPLSIAEIILTVPSSPGSRDFAFLSLRNFIIESSAAAFGDTPFGNYDDSDLIDAIDAINTYKRIRFYSRGKDKLPTGTKNPFHRFVRELFCLKGYYDYWFSSLDSAIHFLQNGEFELYRSADIGSTSSASRLNEVQDYEFSPRSNLRRMPDIGDISNLIWGLPIPVRGADVIFRGGIKFPKRKGLVLAVQGGPGSGKTSLALGFSAALAGFGIGTFFFSAEESEADLLLRANSLVPDAYRRLSFYPSKPKAWLNILDMRAESKREMEAEPGLDIRLGLVTTYLDAIEERLSEAIGQNNFAPRTVHSPCRLVIVLDGLHDLINRAGEAADQSQAKIRNRFHIFLERCKNLEALVILTVGDNWQFGDDLDYLVDTAIHLRHDTSLRDSGKPERQLTLSKARHQSCSAGTHSFQISGEKGLRFTPQIHFCLETASVWKMQLHDENFEKRVLCKAAKEGNWTNRRVSSADFEKDFASVRLYRSSNIFINGQGSGGKAGMALKIASSPFCKSGSDEVANLKERILVISFLYPEDYYLLVHANMRPLREYEYSNFPYKDGFSRIDVIQFYPGFLKPSSLFNRIRWSLEEADCNGDPYTTVILDGLHNVFIQFPELEKMQMVWPQLYSMLRQRTLMIITTHTVLTVPTLDGAGKQGKIGIDDFRSDPLRHALVQKTDYSFEVDPVEPDHKNSDAAVQYEVRTLSAIGQALPGANRRLCWHREQLFFYDGGLSRGRAEPRLI
jgi:KaiC/GvpD/RAD55 family RecA-like ATPase